VNSRVPTEAGWRPGRTGSGLGRGARRFVLAPPNLEGSPTVVRRSSKKIHSRATAVYLRTPEPPVRTFRRLAEYHGSLRAVSFRNVKVLRLKAVASRPRITACLPQLQDAKPSLPDWIHCPQPFECTGVSCGRCSCVLRSRGVWESISEISEIL